jgi:hypothetical protein
MTSKEKPNLISESQLELEAKFSGVPITTRDLFAYKEIFGLQDADFNKEG